MIRIIIIDDEILARIGIQTFCENCNMAEVIGIFSSAEDALEFLHAGNSVDVVITDIEMSGMNGLDFIQKIKNEQLCKGVIVISSHDNFSYVRESLKLDADDYILKQELTEECLSEAISKIYKKQIASVISDSSAPVSRNPVIPTNCLYCIGLPQISFPNTKEDLLTSTSIDQSMIIHLLENIVQEENMGCILSPFNKKPFILFFFNSALSNCQIHQVLLQYVQKLIQNIGLYLNSPVHFICSLPFDDTEKINYYYDSCIELLSFRFYKDEPIFFQDKKMATQPIREFTIPRDAFIKKDWTSLVISELNHYIDFCFKNCVPVITLKKHVAAQIEQLLFYLDQKYCLNQDNIRKFENQLNYIWDIDNRSSYVYELQNLLTLIRFSIKESLSKDPMKMIVVYINEHIDEHLTLSEISKICGMSISGFSKSFKEYTQLTYVQYLNRKRVERIQFYIDNGRYSLEEISQRMDFQNVNYMTRLFKKVTGLTVTQYKTLKTNNR